MNSYARANLKTLNREDNGSAIIDGEYFELQELKDFLENEA